MTSKNMQQVGQPTEDSVRDGFASGHNFSRAVKSFALFSRADFSPRESCFFDFSVTSATTNC